MTADVPYGDHVLSGDGRKIIGTADGYKWTVYIDECMGGWDQTYYYAISPEDVFIADGFTTGPLQDGIDICFDAIEAHKKGELEI